MLWDLFEKLSLFKRYEVMYNTDDVSNGFIIVEKDGVVYKVSVEYICEGSLEDYRESNY